MDHSIDLGVPGGRQLLELVDAHTADNNQTQANNAVAASLGWEGLVDAAAVFANFEMMNRVAEGTGIPVPPQAVEREAETMKTLGLYDILKCQPG